MAAVLAGLLAVPPAVVKAQAGLIHEEESRYQFIQVVQSGEERRLYLNEGYAIHSVWRPDTVLTGGEWDMFLAAPPLLGRPARRATTLGNAAGTTARAFGVYYPQARIDGVELDPAVTAVGRRWFGLDDNPRLTVHTADARPFLAEPRTRATTSSSSTPTVSPTCPSTWRRASSSGSAGSGSRPAASSPSTCPRCPATTGSPQAVAGTLRAEFPQVVTWQALRFNQFVVGLTRPLPRAVMTARLGTAPRDLLPLTRLFARDLREAAPAARPWTRRPRAGGVDHRQDDRVLRPARRRDAGAAPAHGARLRGETGLIRAPSGFSGTPSRKLSGHMQSGP